MRTVLDLIELANDELGLHLRPEDAGTAFDDLPEWDSVHLLRLVTALEDALGGPVPVAEVLGAASLTALFDLAVRP
ncbi:MULTISPECIES: phosphopantetheine-binding protein [unclassified Streptomyces]|uniref:phosphopantetheine-binding protein n=1 Tax=unclassified Streptomyces TaxID=2593676 RepID=UPI0011AF91FD|nr:phosphopantetheine-binding protein [Streptomyces sp. CB02959]